MEKKNIVIATDGGCSMKNRLAGWAFVAEVDGQKHSESGAFYDMTNNQAELFAAIAGLNWAKTNYGKKGRIVIVTDSEYLQKGANDWLKKWKQRKWKTRKGPVLNQGYWIALDELLQELDVTITWVRGHNGNEINEEVDSLAVAAYRKFIKE